MKTVDIIRIIAVISSLWLAGCVFVQPTVEGKKVRLLAAHEVEQCRNLGSITSRVQDRVGVILRSQEAVEDDVLQNAKNEAADMRGDTLVATSAIENGKQTFGVYRCLTP